MDDFAQKKQTMVRLRGDHHSCQAEKCVVGKSILPLGGAASSSNTTRSRRRAHSGIAVFFQEQEFLAKQKEDLELAMKNIIAQNKKEICDKERECLNKKQQLMRGGWQRLQRRKANAQHWVYPTLALPTQQMLWQGCKLAG